MRMRQFAKPTLAATLSVLLFACGNQKPAESTTTDAQAAPEAKIADGAVASDAVLSATQEVTVNNGAEPESLDPHKVSGVPESNILRQMLVGLTTTDKDGNTIGGMATEWSSPDNKVWTFKLRDAKWSNGDPVTAQDFVYSFRRLVDPVTASPYSSYLADAKVVNAQEIVDGKAKPDTLGVKAIDDKTFEVTLSEPVPYFPDMMIHTSVNPVNQKAVEAGGDKWTAVGNYVANGPYILKDWKINEYIVLERNPSYYDDANTKINKVTLLTVDSSTTDLTRFKAGEIDVTADSLPPEQFDQIKADFKDELKISPKLCTYYYDINQTRPPFNDVKVRRALALAIDREAITNQILKQGQIPAYQFSPVATQYTKAYEPEWKAWDRPKRLEEAKKLLAEAGYSAEKPLKFKLLYNTNDQHKTLAVAATSMWKEALPIEVELENQEWKTYLETKRQGKFDMARAGWCADYNEQSTFLNIFKTGNSNNYGKFTSSVFDAAMAESLQAGLSTEARADVYLKAEKALSDDEMGAIFVYQYVSPRLVNQKVAGFSNKDPQSLWKVKDWSIVEAKK